MNPIPDIKRQYALDEIAGLGYFKSMEWVESIDSTNKQLVQSVRQQSIPLPALVVADRQSSGVGRGSHQWWSPTGCLMFSMAIPIGESELSDAESLDGSCVSSALLPLRVGYAVAECLEPFSSAKPLVKWPNDVYISGRKVCGVLIEVIPKSLPLSSIAVIGIGINCQVDFQGAPAEIRANATSLHEWSRSKSTELASTENVLVQFIHQWLSLEQQQNVNPRWLLDHWGERSLLDGQWVTVKHSAGLAQGRCLGIGDSGALRVQNERLEVIEILAGTIQSFRPL